MPDPAASAFQSSPGPKAGRSVRLARTIARALSSFNPRPARRPGAPPSSFSSSSGMSRVSILARPEGRALLRWAAKLCAMCMRFQSSPGPKAGRSSAATASARREGATGFNPRPARRPGAPHDRGSVSLRPLHVSILARPEGRALPEGERRREFHLLVSILARPEGRALQSVIRPPGRGARGFNPRPARRPGAPCWGSKLGGALLNAHHRVSILARPEGRALQWRRPRCAATLHRFNPRPARRPGAPRSRPALSRRRASRFNPRPARRPGAPAEPRGGVVLPLPVSILARPEGRALHRHEPGWPGSLAVSILARPEGRALPRSCVASAYVLRVSILARPEGRALLTTCPPIWSSTRRFNPRPARRPGAPCWCTTPHPGASFNPRPARRPGAPWRWRRRGRLRRTRFNPRPARRPGAPRSRGASSARATSFQSSPGPKAGRSSTFPTKMGRAPTILAGSRRFAGPCAPADPGALLTAPSHSLDRARVTRLSVCADGSRTPRSQKTSGPRWSNFGGTPNTCR